MPVYDDEIKAREGHAAGDDVPSSDGSPSAAAGNSSSKSDGDGVSKQLRQKENQTGDAAGAFPNIAKSLAKGGGMPAFSLGGVGGAALKILGRSLWGTNKRKAATLGSGSGVMAILGIMWIVNFTTGPLSFIHLGEILSKHFDPMTHQTEVRMGRIFFQELFNPPDDVKNPIGDNRLSFLGYLMKNKTLNDLAKAGFKPQLKSDGFSFDGFSVDPTNQNSPYHQDYQELLGKAEGADEAAILKELSATIRDKMDPNGKLGLIASVEDGKIIIRGKQTLFSDTGIKAMSDMLVSGDHPYFADPIWDFIRVRNLSRWTISGNFHWLSKINAKVTSAKDAWLKENIYDPIKNGLKGNSSDGVAIQGKDSNGNPTETPLDGGTGPVSETSARSFLSDPKGFADAAGGIAAAAAIICILQAIDKAVGIIKYMQILLLQARMSWVPLSISSQFKASKDVDIGEASAVADSTFNSYDKNGNVTSTFYDSMSLRSTAGDTGGTDLSQSVKDMISNADVPWLNWTKSGAVNALCSTAAQVTLTAVSVGLLLVPGVDVLSAALGVVVFGAGTSILMNWLPGVLAGQGINIKASGAEWGSDVDYGARVSASQHALQYGGVAISQQEENQQVAEANAQDLQQFQSQSLADRIFNPDNYQSLVGNMIDRAGIYSTQDLFAKIGTIPNILGSLFNLPASIVTASAHAASPYQYPFPMIGFSNADINSSIVNQPFDNADQVSAILDNEENSGDHTYIDKALNCFGVSITKGDQGWDAVPTNAPGTDGQDHTFGVNPWDSANYDQYNCTDTGNTDWLRIRIWILDLSTMEGYACSQGDGTSCENSGFNTASATITPGTVTFVSQNDPQWANSTINTGKTMSQDGCVLAVESMVVSSLTGNFVSPVELDQKYGGNNDPYSHYSLKASGMWANKKAITPATTASMQQVISTIKAGGLVAVYAFNDSTQPFWGTPGHEELIRGIAPDGNLLVYDPWDMPDSSNHFIPNASYPNDSHKHSASEYPPSNFIQPGVSFDFITKGN